MTKVKFFLFRNSVMLVMLVLIVVFSFTSPYFLTVKNLVNLLNQNSYFIIAAVGLGILMISGAAGFWSWARVSLDSGRPCTCPPTAP